MTKLISGRHEKIPSGNVSAERYQFLSIQEAEPDLGLPSALGQVFTSNLTGTRSWVNLSTSTIQEGSNLYYTDARVLANVSAMGINVLTDVYITQPNLNDVLTWDGSKFIAQAASAAAVAGTANVAYVANVANSVVSLAGHTTTEIAEGANLYFTNARVLAALYSTDVNANNLIVKNSVITTNVVANVITANSFVSTGVGVPTLSSATNINLSANGANGGAVVVQSSALRLKTYTYDGANALTASSGDLVFNSNSKATLAFNGTVWEEVGSRLPLIKAGVINANSIVINGTEIVSGNEGIANIFVTRITANVWNNLYTANVIETAGNLYFTNARVVSALIPGSGIIIEANGRISANITTGSLNTSQVSEVSSNLYFTNARVYSALSNANIEGNLRITGTFYGNSIVINGTEIVNGTTGEANLYVTRLVANTISTNVIVINGVEIITGTGADANISVTNLRANVGVFVDLYANNISALGNLILGSGVGGNITGVNRVVTQFVYSNVIYSNSIIVNGTEIVNGQSGESNLFVTRITANVWNNLYTANVIETAGNLYFTNSRVAAALIAGDNVRIEPNGRISANVTLGSLGAITTDNVSEGTTNKYFTNARVVAALVAGTGIVIESNGRISANVSSTTSTAISAVNPLLTTANVTELNNLYYTNSRVVSAVTPLLTTANVSELGNLYYTNARARTAITGGTGVTVDWSTGSVSIGQDVSTSANVTFYNLNVTNNLVVYGGVERFQANNLVVSDNMIYLNNGSINSNPDVGFAFNYNDGTYHHAGFFRDHSDGKFKVFENYSPEPDANIFIDTAHASFRVANIQATTFFGNVSGTVSSLDNQTTSALKEGSNLYYTNARVLVGITTGTIQGNITVSDTITANNFVSGNGTGGTITGASLLSSANVVTTNLTATSWFGLYTANVVETAGNLYFTNSRVVAALIAGNNVTIEPNGRISSNITGSLGSVTTDNVNEGVNNLYYTNTRVRSVFSAGQNIIIEANGRISANLTQTIANITAVIDNLTTDGVNEGSINLYYTNSRVVSAIVPSLTTANVSELGNLYFTGARAVTAVTPLLTAANIANFVSTVNATVQPFLTTANVIETSANLYFTNARVVAALSGATISGNLTVTGRFSANSLTIQGIDVTNNVTAGNVSASGFSGNSLVVESVTANSWNRLYTANVIETSGNLYFTNTRVVAALSQGTAIIIEANGRISANLFAIATNAVVINDSKTIISTGNTSYDLGVTVSNPRNILVSVEGILQIPITDYLTTGGTGNGGNTLVFTGSTGPAVGSNIEVKFFGSEGVLSALAQSTSTTGVSEGVNLYFTNTRAIAAVTSTITAALTTGNVVETTNLYFTNARVAPALTHSDISKLMISPFLLMGA